MLLKSLRVHFFNNVPKPFIYLQISHILVHKCKLLNFENLSSFWCALSVGQPYLKCARVPCCFCVHTRELWCRERPDELEMFSTTQQCSKYGCGSPRRNISFQSSTHLGMLVHWQRLRWWTPPGVSTREKKLNSLFFFVYFQQVDFSFVVFVWSGPRFKSLHLWTRMWLICKYLVRCWKNGLLKCALISCDFEKMYI